MYNSVSGVTEGQKVAIIILDINEACKLLSRYSPDQEAVTEGLLVLIVVISSIESPHCKWEDTP